MSKYVTSPGGVEFPDVGGFADNCYPTISNLIRSLYTDLLTAKAAADKAIALAYEGTALLDKLQAENACLRVEIADADQRIIELDEALERADDRGDRLYDEVDRLRRELDRLELVK